MATRWRGGPSPRGRQRPMAARQCASSSARIRSHGWRAMRRPPSSGPRMDVGSTGTRPSTRDAGGGSRWRSRCASTSRFPRTDSISGGTTPARASRTIAATRMPSAGAQTRFSTIRPSCTRRSMRFAWWWRATGARRWLGMLPPRCTRRCARRAATPIRRPPSGSAPCAPRKDASCAPNAGIGTVLNCVRWSSTRSRCGSATTPSRAWKS